MATQSECADWLDISERRLRELIDEGVIDRAEKGQYDVKAVVQQYVRNLREIAAGRGGGSGTKAEDEARLAKAKADKAEMEAAQMRGELIPADTIAETLQSAVMVMKTRMLAVPPRAASEVGARNVASAEKVIRGHINEALTELSQVEVFGPAA